MAARLFEDDDSGYLSWIAEHPDGFVLNIQRGFSATDARVHSADCESISGTPSHGDEWTVSYVKVCAASMVELDAWATANAGGPVARCKTCSPP
jgi:hypothetical protein